MILAFASLSEMFAQKAESSEADGDEPPSIGPYLNSKYQETVFQRVFGAAAEDIGNTSYDVSMDKTDASGRRRRYLVGIKTFLRNTNDQKVAQFKADSETWAETVQCIDAQSHDEQGKLLTRDEINAANQENYEYLARQIADLRNVRIDSSEATLHGFTLSDEDRQSDGTGDVERVYHVLMPSGRGEEPSIAVGETDYAKIDIDNIRSLGCSSRQKPVNFRFTDGHHEYKYTVSDSQLYMNFHNADIVQETWPVRYADDAYEVFASLARQLFPPDRETQDADTSSPVHEVIDSSQDQETTPTQEAVAPSPDQEEARAVAESRAPFTEEPHETPAPHTVDQIEPDAELETRTETRPAMHIVLPRLQVTESYAWGIDTAGGEVPRYSGFNGFYGVGSKLGKGQRERAIEKIRDYPGIDLHLRHAIADDIARYLQERASNDQQKRVKEAMRETIMLQARAAERDIFERSVAKLVYRPMNEMYIPLPHAREFHQAHPDFFAPHVGLFRPDGKTLLTPKEFRRFTLVFEPSGSAIEAFITQECGKAIELCDQQSILGEWILRGVFQLAPYEPLTHRSLARVGLNGIRLYRLQSDDAVHLQFIWLDEDNLPNDYWDGHY